MDMETSDQMENNKIDPGNEGDGYQAHLLFLESLDRIDRAIQGTNDIEQMMRDALNSVLSIFDCDRVFLFYPCDPEAAFFRVPMEITKPEYPGAKVLNVDVPMFPDMSQNLREILDSDVPVTYVAGTERPVNKVTAEQFGVQSQIVGAIYPKVGRPYAFGMHQCSRPRIWTADEISLFQEISRRMADGLTSLLVYRNLQESEEKYRHIIETTSEGVWVTDKDFVTTFVNPRMLDILGYEEKEILGRKFDDFVVPEELVDHQLQVEERRKGNAGFYERRLIRKDGKEIWCDVSATPLLDNEKRFMGSFGMMTDITDRKSKEEKLRKAMIEIQNLMRNIPEVLYVLDTENNIIQWNRKAEDASGYSAEELSRKLVFELIPEHERPSMIDMVNDAYGKGYAEIRSNLVRKDGVIVPYRWSAAPLNDEKGNNSGVIGIGWDLSEQIEKEEKMRAYQLQQRVILDTIPDMVWMKDSDGVYLAANEAFLIRVGKQRGDVIGKTDFDVWPKEYAENYRAGDGKVMSSRAQSRIEENITDLKGNIIRVETIKTPVYDDAGSLLGVTGIARDITDRMEK